MKPAYADALAAIRTGLPIPAFDGGVDIYNYSQGFLLASDNVWAPRPVTQSYSAYLPSLAKLDAEHLKGAGAPRTVLFRPESIDGRLPALDDGPSWPLILRRYDLIGRLGDYAVLRANGHAPDAAAEPGWQDARVGETVNVSAGRRILAWVDVRPTLLGKLLAIAHKPPPVMLDVSHPDRPTERFRLISGMARAGFLLSPVVTTTDEFAALLGLGRCPGRGRGV